MKIVKINNVPKDPVPSQALFTGSNVTRQSLELDGKELDVAVVNFGKGVRSKLHTHDCEQLLIVTAGRGMVATEKEQRVVTPGDVILISKGEKHSHGATEDSEFSHIYVMKPGSKLTQNEA